MGRPKKNPDATGTAVSTQTAKAPAKVAPQAEPSLLAIIARAASDPAVDVLKMEKLLDMKERLDREESRRQYDIAFGEMQADLPVITRRGTIEIRDKGNPQKVLQSTPYAKWDDIAVIIKPILGKHGFALWFKNEREGDQVIVQTVLSHSAGHREETTMRLPLDLSGSKNNVQGVGSSTSYGKRYGAGSLLNLVFEDEDDDGVAGGQTTDERRSKRADDKLGDVAEKTARRATGKAKEADSEKQAPKLDEDGHKPFPGDEPGEKSAPKAEAPSAADDPDAYFKFLEKALGKVKMIRDLNALWNDHVKPVEEDIFETDFPKIREMFNAKRVELGGKK